MKYILIVQGTKEEIETAKTYGFDCFEDISGFGDNPFTPEVRFEIVEPKYRIKTLGELAKEFGEELSLSTCGQDIVVQNRYHTALSHLGLLYTGLIEYKYKTVSANWKQTFLKEV
jgi:hypothetical protein